MPGFTLADLTQAVDSRKRMYGNIIRGLLDDPGATLAQLAAVDSENAKANRLRGGGLLSVMPEVRDQAQQESVQQALNLGGLLGMIAYHGSPHTFDKFDMSKIGTGEGAQAYGHGLYFAENPGVAKQYAGMSTGSLPRASDIAHVAAAKDFMANGMDPAAGLKAAYPGIKPTEVEGAIAEAKGGYKPNMYKVDIPDDAVAKMLDWDKPLSQQPEAVRKAITSSGAVDDLAVRLVKHRANGYDLPKDTFDSAVQSWRDHLMSTPGGSLYKTMATAQGGDSAAAEYLRSLGIPGIRYLDAGSRGSGGTSNFVLFDDQLPKIIGRE